MKLIYRNAILIIALLLCLANNTTQAQQTKLRNAYEIARSMYATKNFDTSQKGLIHEKLMSALVWYTEVESFEDLDLLTRSNKLLNDHIIKTAGYFIKADSVLDIEPTEMTQRLQKLNIQKTELIGILVEYRRKKTDQELLVTISDQLNRSLDATRGKRMEIEQSRKETKRQLIGLKSLLFGVDTVLKARLFSELDTMITAKNRQIEISDTSIKRLVRLEDSIYYKQRENYKKLNAANKEIQDVKQKAQDEIVKNEYQNYREQYLDKNYTTQVLNDMYNPAVFKSNSLEFAAAASGLDQQVHIQVSGQSSSGGFQMPSQSQMIDAVAVYLAKRVKQEAVLWFFESIKKNAETDELINICFPESIEMLKSGDLFEVPNFGASWRYAMSKDFITLPENVFSSPWLARNVASEYHGTLRDMQLALTISRLLQQNYNYYDMIRYLYLNNDGMRNRSGAKNLITMLYSINQEMVNSINDSSSHLLSYEELNSMPAEAFTLMIQLMDVKYDKVFTKIFGKLDRMTEKEYRKRFIQYIGRIQLASQKIDKVKGQFKDMIDENKGTNNANYTYLSPWKFMGELLQVVTPDTNLVSPSTRAGESFNMSIRYLIKTQEIFENIEQKNYTGAVKMTIGLVDSLTSLKSHYQNNNSGIGRIYDMLLSQYGPGNKVLDSTVTSFKVPTYWVSEWKQMYRISQNAIVQLNRNVELYNFLTNSTKEQYPESGKATLIRDETGGIYATVDSPEIYVGNRKIRPALNADESLLVPELTALLVKTVVTDSLRWDKAFCERAEKYMSFYTGNNYGKSKDIILRLAGFLNDVALTNNSKQLSDVIASYSMPSGSYKRKRSAWYSVDLNAFVGPYAGYEYPVNSNKPAGGVYGITAPIGISYTKLLGRRVKATNIKNGSLFYKSSYRNVYRRSKSTITFGLSIVDIGAVVSYRFTNADSTLPQQFKWEQFISPGLHFSYGIPGTPLVWSFGAVYSPRIRKFADAAAGDKQYNTFRVQTGLLFDLPLLNMWERKSIIRTKRLYRNDLD